MQTFLPNPKTATPVPVSQPVLQRKCACGGNPGPSGECEECRRKKLSLQRQAQNLAALHEIPPMVHDVLRSPGQPLDASARAFMEPRFGHDFGQVQVHTDGRAAESTAMVNALAYTVGQDIVFAPGQYSPHTHTGKRLIAHELTHVVQQSGIQGAAQYSLAMTQKNDPSEVEADLAADRVLSGLGVANISPVTTAVIQRDESDNDEEPAEKPMTRAEEVSLSRTSPGGITGTARPPVITIYNFAINGSALKPEHKAVLTEVAELIKSADASKVGVVLVGHADSTGSPKVNQPLSKRRAETVKKELETLSGRKIITHWAGDTNPADTNDTVEGRNRNRRVEIHFLPVGGVRPPGETEETPEDEKPPQPPVPDGPEVEPPKDEPPGKEPSGEDPPIKDPPPGREGDLFFCVKYPLICAGIGLGGVAILFCILNPAACLPKIPVLPPPPELDEDKDKDENKDKEKDKDERERPCPIHVDLPSGTIKAKRIGVFLIAGFNMGITFEENPETGCRCYLGEYRQMVRGFAERDDATGVMRPADPPGLKLDRTTYQEDLRGGVARYGWRAEPIGNTDADKFTPDRDTGCEYTGSDSPGMLNGKPGEHMRFRFEFKGGPVDRRMRSLKVGSWSSWIVEGDTIIPKPPPPKPPKPPETPKPPPELPPPEKKTEPEQKQLPLPPPEYEGPSIGQGPVPSKPSDFCLGGTISCKALEFLREQRRKHTFISQDDVNKAVEIEFDVLKKNRIYPPIVDPHQAEDWWKWVASLRFEARNRIRQFAKDYFIPFPD